MGKFQYERFKWADELPPPPKKGPKFKAEAKNWDWVVKKLQSKPDKWARVRTGISGTNVTKLRKQYPDIEWATRPSEKGDNKVDIWGCYHRPQAVEIPSFAGNIPTSAPDWSDDK